MNMRSILGTVLLAIAPLAGAQSVDYVFVRAAQQADAVEVQPAVQSEPAVQGEGDDAAGTTRAVSEELEAMLEQRFEAGSQEPSLPQRLLVSAS